MLRQCVIRGAILAATSLLSVIGYAADTPKRIDIPAGTLSDAIIQLSKQHGIDFFYRPEQVYGLKTNGAHGELTTQEAISKLIEGTALKLSMDSTGAMVIALPEPNDLRAGSPISHAEENALTIQMAQAEASASSPAAGESAAKGADEAEPRIQEIVVTAQKREEKLIDVPISITAISGEKLEDEHINNMQDLSFAVPGMSAAEMGPGRQLITLRGMGGYRGVTSLTGIYLDEIPVSGLQDGFIATYIDMGATDLERVEVLKGPQGTLFGEGSVGGTVRFITQDPDLTSIGGKITASLFGNSDSESMSHEVRGVLNLPIVENKFALRAAVTYDNRAGWIDKLQAVNGPVRQEDINDNELLNVRLKGLWQPTDNLAVKGTVVINRNEGDGSNIVNTGSREASDFIIEFDPTAPTGYTDDYDLYNLTVTYDLGFAQLLSSTSYSETDSIASTLQRKPLIPAPNPGFQEILQRDYLLEGDSFSQELRLSSQSAGRFKWTGGLFYRDSQLATQSISGFDFFRFGVRLAPVGFSSGVKGTQKSESLAIFGDISYALTSNLEAGFGVRYFEEDRDSFDALAANRAATFLSGSFDKATFRSYLSYAFADGIRLYGSASTGFRSGSFNSVISISQGAPAEVKPEEVMSYELGTKMALAGGRVSLQAALFFSEYIDIQMSTIFTNSSNQVVSYISNPGEAELKGFEWQFDWAATERLTLGLNGDVIDTELTKLGPQSQPPSFALGDPIDLVPEYSFGVNADYEVQWLSSVPGFLRLQYNHQGKTTTTLRSLGALEPITHTPTLRFLNASIGAKAGGWDFELFGRNLLDEAGALRSGTGFDAQARPRTIGVRLGKSF